MDDKELTRQWRKAHWKVFAILFSSSIIGLILNFMNIENPFIYVGVFCLGWTLSDFESYEKYKKRMNGDS